MRLLATAAVVGLIFAASCTAPSPHGPSAVRPAGTRPAVVTLSNLAVADSAHANKWSVQSNLAQANRQYGDLTYTFSSLPVELLGQAWIRPADASKSYRFGPLVSFTVDTAASVYVAFDSRIAADKPSWLDSSWNRRTGLVMTDSQTGSNRYDLFRKDFAPGSVKLGPNTDSGTTRVHMYTVVVVPQITVATTSEPYPAAPNPTSSVYRPLSCPNGQTATGNVVDVHSDNVLWYQATADLRYTGFTFYAADRSPGGSSAWHDARFTSYIDRDLSVALGAGQNLLRPTDQFDDRSGAQSWDDPTVWANMDYLVCHAQASGLGVLLDLSFYGKILMAKGYSAGQVIDPSRWTNMIDAVSAHYLNWTAIVAVSFLGEPSTPQTQSDVDHLRAFYQGVLNEYYAHDPYHMLFMGGFTHMNDKHVPGWWQQLEGIAHNSFLAYKIYSQNDKDYYSSFTRWLSRNPGHVLMNNEFGARQQLGDGTSSGISDNGLTESRQSFFHWNYASTTGTKVFVFWNYACATRSDSYDVNNTFTSVWGEVAVNAARRVLKDDYNAC